MKVNFVIADKIERLENGKLIAMGLFLDRVVVLNLIADTPDPTPKLPFGVPLSLAISMTELKGPKFRGSLSIRGPGRTQGHSQDLVADQVQGDSVNIVLNLDPLLVPSAGKYSLVLKVVGERIVRESFEIRIARLHKASK